MNTDALEEIDRKLTQEIADKDMQDRLTLPCRSYERTDLGNAKRLIHRYGRDLLYLFPARKWFIWDGTRYRPDDIGRILYLAKYTASRIIDEAQGLDDQTFKQIMSHAFATHQRRGIEAMIALARSDVAVRPDDLDASPHLLNFKNCTLNLQNLEPQDHWREDRITRSCGCDYLPGASCTEWEKFIHRIMGNKDHLIRFLQRALGYALLGDPAERVIFLLYGPGGNGKSTLIGICADILGDYALQTPSETFLTSKNDRVRNDLARMNGARFVSAIETTKGRRLDESTVKLLTGYQDKIPARYLHQEYFEYRPKFVLFWSFNSKPAIRDTSQAMWDRVLLVPFTVVIPPEERDHILPAKLKAELPGILNWMIQGLIQYREIGLAVPDEVKVATEEYHREEDYVSDFLLTCCEERPDAAEYFSDLFIACCEFCNDTGRDPPTRKGFAKELKARFIHGKDKIGHYYQGLKIAVRKEISSGIVTEKTDIQQNMSGFVTPEKNTGNRDIGNVTDADQ